MNVPVDRIYTSRGGRIVDGLAYACFRDFVAGRREEARGRLLASCIDEYYSPTSNVTTHIVVVELMKERGLAVPAMVKDVPPEFVRAAAAKRVGGYLALLDSIRSTGEIRRKDPFLLNRDHDRFVLRSCGYNEIAAWAASGNTLLTGFRMADDTRITVCACWDGGDYYPLEYVNILVRSVYRNTTLPFAFVLFVGPDALRPGRLDGLDPRVNVVPTGLPWWWSGMVAWQEHPPGVETESILYLDLDQVIVGNIDEIISYPSEQCYMKDWPTGLFPDREKDACVSTSLIRRGAGARVWEEYVRQGMPQWNPLAFPAGRALPMGCQSILNDRRYGMEFDRFPEKMVCSYRLEVLKRGLPEECRIVSFHGQPKPAACLHEAWVKENWR